MFDFSCLVYLFSPLTSSSHIRNTLFASPHALAAFRVLNQKWHYCLRKCYENEYLNISPGATNSCNPTLISTFTARYIIFLCGGNTRTMFPYTNSRVITSYERIASCAGTQFRSWTPESQGKFATRYYPECSNHSAMTRRYKNGLALVIWYHTPSTTTIRLWARTILSTGIIYLCVCLFVCLFVCVTRASFTNQVLVLQPHRKRNVAGWNIDCTQQCARWRDFHFWWLKMIRISE